MGALLIPLLFLSWCLHAQQVSFERDVQPIFAERCQACHNEKNASAGLSLGNPAAVLKGGRSGAAVLPGKAEDSLLLQNISGDKPRMPKFGAPLTRDQVAT